MLNDNTFKNPIQIGLIAEDLDSTLENLQNILGIGPFRIVDYPPAEKKDLKRFYKGEPSDFTAKFCFFDLGNIEFEVIQPLTGKSIWRDFLDKKGPGLHHIKFNVDEHGSAREHFESKGIEVSQMGASVGKNEGKEWVFYNTYDAVGFAVEVMNTIIK
ncbi:MAG: VOC family protein [Clostridia bacterium]